MKHYSFTVLLPMSSHSILVQPALSSVAPELSVRMADSTAPGGGTVARLNLDSATLSKICKLEPAVYEALKRYVVCVCACEAIQDARRGLLECPRFCRFT